MQGLGVETAKTLILAGVKSVTFHFVGIIELWDLSSSFVFSEKDVSKHRALAPIILNVLKVVCLESDEEELDNDYMPPEFLPLLHVIVGNIGNDENDSSILFHLFSSIMEVGEEKISIHIPNIIPSLVGSVSKWLTSNLEPWPQVVEQGITTLAVMAQAWEESEDLSIFDVIKEIVNLDRSYRLKFFLVKEVPPPPAPPVPERSIVEGINAFVTEAIKQYPSATHRACSCVHAFLHCSTYSIKTEGVKQSLAIVFSSAAFSRFVEVRSTPSSLWKSLLPAISSYYLCYPEIVEGIIEKSEARRIIIWASACVMYPVASLRLLV